MLFLKNSYKTYKHGKIKNIKMEKHTLGNY